MSISFYIIPVRRNSSLPPDCFASVCQRKTTPADFFYPRQTGFTLLEMVLVLFIMGLMASLSMVFIDNEDNQLRYRQTLQKLDALHAASINIVNYQNDFIFSGFIADNGALPASIGDYLVLPNNWDSRQLFNSSNPVKYRINSSDSYGSLEDINIYKGYRGSYLNAGLDSNGDYKTGWGNDFSMQITANNLQLSYDEMSINATEFALPNSRTVSADSWSITLSELKDLQLTNSTGSDISAKAYKLAISVFNNKNTTDPKLYWHTYHVDFTLTLDQGDSTNLSLSAWKDDSGASAQTIRVPAGKHPVFIVESGVHGTELSEKLITVIPGYTQPEIKLTLQP